MQIKLFLLVQFAHDAELIESFIFIQSKEYFPFFVNIKLFWYLFVTLKEKF